MARHPFPHTPYRFSSPWVLNTLWARNLHEVGSERAGIPADATALRKSSTEQVCPPLNADLVSRGSEDGPVRKCFRMLCWVMWQRV